MKRILFLALACLALFARAQDEKQVQWKTLEADIKAKGDFKRQYEEAYCREATILPEDRDPLDVVLRRTAALAADLAAMKVELAAERAALAALTEKAKGIQPGTDARQTLFGEALDLRRKIAFSNPLLDFDKIIFIKRDVSRVMEHMADQYYGTQQTPGGSLFVLEGAFSNPVPRDLLANATVEKGRLKGKMLTTGSTLSPALSFDAKKLAFAYVECEGSKRAIPHLDHANNGHWERGRSYHLFSMNLDGSNLTQLTDGTFNDHFPCFMPSGRIAFLSERRGAFIRCGRYCPVYTMHDMAADGSDIRCLSVHDVSEWSPVVNNDGRLLWTRWDYVDRHGCTAHMPWLTAPDGRDPRPLHGNYSLRYKRADAEIDTRPIPASRNYISTASPHHGQSFGALIFIDPAIADDDAMGPVRRFTPEVKFPESENTSARAYATPWPLSDAYHLCAYAPAYSGAVPRHNFGLYLVDKFGNKELIYRDPAIASLTPIPLKAVKAPPVIPEHRQPKGTEATVAVADVYKSLLPWPEGEAGQVKALRVWQLYPMSVSSDEMKRNIGVQIPEGSDSVNLVRAVLGTVPVEPDGSAHFKVPSGIQLFFQALDSNGCAIQSMRSSIVFVPGETLSCVGCHEPKTETAPGGKAAGLQALRRPPSKLKPGPEGSRPFSYPILVQPVLDKKCVACHAENKETAPRLDSEIVRGQDRAYYSNSTHTFYASYNSLAKPHGFTTYGAGHDFNNAKFYRTIPGKFGARASKLYPLLKKGHHGVKLTDEEMQRIIIWLDSVSQFYGVYEPEGLDAQLRGEVVWPTLE